MKKKANGSSTVGQAVRTMREKLVGNILYYAGDEFETTDDVTELAMESEEELIDRLINILDYYYDKCQELS
jgi:hypothetical protein